ncbi:MAG: cytochrome b N-terminal domain-containing protein [bacterium]
MKYESLKILFNKIQFGFLSYSSFFICIITGIVLAFVYDSIKPDYSISLMILINKPALFIRSLHYWSAQIFLITSVFHIIDHLLKKTEMELKSTTWFGLVFLIPVLFYAMFSGFLLKGDYDSNQALNIIISVLNSLPYFGKFLSNSLFGDGLSYNIIFINHIITSTLIIWLLTIEHSKKILPSARGMLQIIPLTILLSALFIPSISNHITISPKGPWYFTGVQEIFHWLSHPEIIIYVFTLFLIVFVLLKYIKDKNTNKLKLSFLILFIAYSLLTLFALFFRGENWESVLPWKEESSVFNFLEMRHLKSVEDSIIKKQIPAIQGKIESCLYCHSDMEGLSISHEISAIGCYSCHLGNPLSSDIEIAHRGMSLTPGNLDVVDKTCGTSNCHPEIADRVSKSLMTSMSGVVAVSKYVFDEVTTPDGHFHVDKIGFSESETHLRGLCASCHLSNNKLEPEQIDELSRGGGCSACHLNYPSKAMIELIALKSKKKFNPKYHPEININVSNKSCFGCHSRSGRISTNFEGWHETTEVGKREKGKGKRELADGRVFEKQAEDIHFSAGMQCIDCHNSFEIMGNGKKYLHEENAVKIRCEDCHNEKPILLTINKMDSESRKISAIRNIDDTSKLFVMSGISRIPFLNTYMKSGKVVTKLKSNGKKLIVKPTTVFCGKDYKGHKKLDCKACHTSWAPQCIGCHTEFKKNVSGFDNLSKKDTKGAWVENGRDFIAEFPSLGIVKDKESFDKLKVKQPFRMTYTEKISTFVPGMIITIKKDRKNIFKRLFAPAFSHTIQKKATSCKTCHNNPVAIGYGRGELKYVVKNKEGKWYFFPKYKLSGNDNLPADAWIDFLNESKILRQAQDDRLNNNSTRTNTRPFNLEEQKRILFVGSCFSCHFENEKKVLSQLKEIKNIKNNISKKCVLPK